MAEEMAMATTGRMKAVCREWRSATQPIIVGEGTSPRMWMMKMFNAIAVARMWAPAELMTAALSGDVLSKRKKAATAIAGTIKRPRADTAMIIKGMPSAMLAAETK